MKVIAQFLLLSLLWACSVSAAGKMNLMDAQGKLSLASLSSDDATSSSGLMAVISSPGTPSSLFASDDVNANSLVWDSEQQILSCQGATLRTVSTTSPLAVVGNAATGIILEGITAGDIEFDFLQSRHARTLTALFRASSATPQTIVLVVKGDDEFDAEDLVRKVKTLHEAVAAENTDAEEAPVFEERYRVEVVSESLGTQEILSKARTSDASSVSLSSALTQAYQEAVPASTSATLDTPSTASATVHVLGSTYTQLTQTVRAKLAAWNSRAARGLLVDNFGTDATTLRQRTLTTFDSQTRSLAGVPTMSLRRQELRQKLQTLLDQGITQAYEAQVENLRKSSLRRLQNAMLKTIHEPAESVMETNAAALRKESFTVETVLENLQVPLIGLTKEKTAIDISNQLSDAVTAFPDSPLAQVKRLAKVNAVTKKEKKPSQRSIDLGLDLVAMLRPDGFGSLQGYAGYQLGGNSITFGIHNDADDPQTIAQFGGVRPPLLRVQPKLRVDVEL